MFKKVQQFLLILFMFQFVLGSTAWMYSSHFCKMEDGCDESIDVSCCAQEMELDGMDIPSSDEMICPTSSTQSCCFEVNSYINFPVYRIIKTELPSDHIIVASLFEKSLDLLGGNAFFEEDHLCLNFSGAESPPQDKLTLLNVFRI